MCDTLVATGEVTADGRVLFAKNSDREASEAQLLEVVPPRVPRGSLTATYIEVPESEPPRRVLLSRPHWMWGAEMGANDAGVVIGNEAVFTRVRPERVGLLGMDLLRLTLERSASAEGAVGVLTALLEEHGQGGPAGHRDKRFRYDNSFLIADPDDAWVLETAGRAWVAARVRGVRAISNGLTIRDEWDRAADGLAARARDAGLEPGRGRVDFARTFADPWITRAAAARGRRGCSEAYLRGRAGEITPQTMMAALRQHGSPDDPRRASRGVAGTVCAHASWLPNRRAAQTTASLVSHLAEERSTHFATGTAAPCTSVFKPLWLDAAPDLGPAPGDDYDADSLWWQHERVHRRALSDLPRFVELIAGERDAFDARVVAAAAEMEAAPVEERRALSERFFAEARALDARWLDRAVAGRRPGLAYAAYWDAEDRRAGLE